MPCRASSARRRGTLVSTMGSKHSFAVEQAAIAERFRHVLTPESVLVAREAAQVTLLAQGARSPARGGLGWGGSAARQAQPCPRGHLLTRQRRKLDRAQRGELEVWLDCADDVECAAPRRPH